MQGKTENRLFNKKWVELKRGKNQVCQVDKNGDGLKRTKSKIDSTSF